MKRILTPVLLLVLAAGVASAQDPAAQLDARIQAAAKKTSDAFVFFQGGSGVFISADGWALTNHHVIAAGNAEAPLPQFTNVWLADARQFKARIVCSDPVGDITLVKIDSDKPFPAVEFADSDQVQPGQIVVAVGNPLGMANVPAADQRYYPSVSAGIVSCTGRYQEQYTNCIQTDAAVNPGNSGGPLVDLEGRLVGINGRIATRHANRVNSGVGWAIPSNQIRNFLPAMKAGGIQRKIHHGQVNGLRLAGRPTAGDGAVVERVDDFSPASRWGFKTGDVILAVNGSKVTSPWKCLSLIGAWPHETEVKFQVRRGTESVEVKAVLNRYEGVDIMGKREDARPAGAGYLGITVNTEKNGEVVIDFVREESPADEAGLLARDVILEVDGARVVTHESVLDRIYAKKPGEKVVLKVRRGDEVLEVPAVLAARKP